jgi:hypothetical protein
MTGRQKEREARKLAKKAKASRATRIQQLLWAGQIRSADEVPQDAIPADLGQQSREGQWTSRKWYTDVSYRCKDCGKPCQWTALEQLWYYEIAKGPLSSEASRCEPCRIKHRTEAANQSERLKEATQKRSSASAVSAIENYLRIALIHEQERDRLLDLVARPEAREAFLAAIPDLEHSLDRTLLRKKLITNSLDRPALLYAPPTTFGEPMTRLREMVGLEIGPFLVITRDGKAGAWQPGPSRDSCVFFDAS